MLGYGGKSIPFQQLTDDFSNNNTRTLFFIQNSIFQLHMVFETKQKNTILMHIIHNFNEILPNSPYMAV